MSFRKYRALDLSIWLVIYLVFEFIIVRAATKWFPDQAYSVSLMLPMLLLIMMRWGPYVSIHAVLFGAAFVLFNGWPGTWQQYVIYLIGNGGFMITLWFLLGFGKDRVKGKWYYTVLYAAIGFISMEVFRGIAAIIVSNKPFEVITSFIFTDMLSFAFAVIVLLIARQVPGLFQDQAQYVRNVQKEAEE